MRSPAPTRSPTLTKISATRPRMSASMRTSPDTGSTLPGADATHAGSAAAGLVGTVGRRANGRSWAIQAGRSARPSPRQRRPAPADGGTQSSYLLRLQLHRANTLAGSRRMIFTIAEMRAAAAHQEGDAEDEQREGGRQHHRHGRLGTEGDHEQADERAEGAADRGAQDGLCQNHPVDVAGARSERPQGGELRQMLARAGIEALADDDRADQDAQRRRRQSAPSRRRCRTASGRWCGGGTPPSSAPRPGAASAAGRSAPSSRLAPGRRRTST